MVDQGAVHLESVLQVLGINSDMPKTACDVRSSVVQEGNNSHRSPSIPLHPQSGEDWLPFSPLLMLFPLLGLDFFPPVPPGRFLIF